MKKLLYCRFYYSHGSVTRFRKSMETLCSCWKVRWWWSIWDWSWDLHLNSVTTSTSLNRVGYDLLQQRPNFDCLSLNLYLCNLKVHHHHKYIMDTNGTTHFGLLYSNYLQLKQLLHHHRCWLGRWIALTLACKWFSTKWQLLFIRTWPEMNAPLQFANCVCSLVGEWLQFWNKYFFWKLIKVSSQDNLQIITFQFWTMEILASSKSLSSKAKLRGHTLKISKTFWPKNEFFSLSSPFHCVFCTIF